MSRKISDRSAPLGSGRKGSVFPEDVKVSEMKTPSGAGMMTNYPDKEGDIYRGQEAAISKAKSRPMKPNFRN
jgi:hypothetical protein